MAGSASLFLVNQQPAAKSRQKAGGDYAYVDQIFRRYDCVDCHNSGPRASGQLNLTTPEGILKGSRFGKAIIPGDAAHSVLVNLINGKPGRRMPPEGDGLTKDEVAIVTRWVDGGAQSSDYGRALSSYYAARTASRWHDALEACKEIGRLKLPGIATNEISTRSSIPVLAALHDEKGWYAATKKAVRFRPLNAGLLNAIAWTIIDPNTWLHHRNTSLALEAAELAVQNTQRRSGAILDTLAWAYYRTGQRDRALTTEGEALKCGDAKGNTLSSIREDIKTFSG